MNEKKYVFPEGMMTAAHAATPGITTGQWCILRDGLEAAIRWLGDNPIVPTDEQVEDMCRRSNHLDGQFSAVRATMIEWPMRMFIEPEPEIPEAIKEFIIQESPVNSDAFFRPDVYNARIIEAYRRGQKDGFNDCYSALPLER